MDNFVDFYFKRNGTVGRRDYCMKYLLVLFIVGFGLGIIGTLVGASDTVILLLSAIIHGSTFSVYAKRFADFGYNKWWAVTPYIPFVGIVVQIALMFVPSDKRDIKSE